MNLIGGSGVRNICGTDSTTVRSRAERLHTDCTGLYVLLDGVCSSTYGMWVHQLVERFVSGGIDAV